jgi:hypothetical protein
MGAIQTVDSKTLATSPSKQTGIVPLVRAVSNAKLQDTVGVADDALSSSPRAALSSARTRSPIR